jgi:hypothetical protein
VTDISPTPLASLRGPSRKEDRPDIHLPDGETLEPRIKFAARVGISDKTAQRLNLPTVFIAAVAYVKRNASLELLASRARRRNEPPARHRRSK